ncbi:MAG: thioredoxin family protein [Bacteroidales bacterium]|nr:thioredoxin family protein [Bacteroidales bacterium]
MISTSLALAVVAGFAAAGSLAQPPAWQPDYAVAYKTATLQQKPLAVFIGHGTKGYTDLITEGGMSAETAKMLSQKFVCLYVDTNTDAGQKLARSFEMTAGVVVSDHTGTIQAFRHAGTLTATELTGQLARLAQPVPAPAPVSVPAPVVSASYYAPPSVSSLGSMGYFRSSGGG